MAIDVRRLFKANCGPDAKYLAHEFKFRGEWNVIEVKFRLRGGRTFQLDGVLHQGATDDEQAQNAVLKIAGIAKNIRAVLAQPDGSGSIKVERQLS